METYRRNEKERYSRNFEIKNNAKGYKNFLRHRNRCLYCMNKTTKPNYAGSHKSIRMKGWPRGCYKKNK